MPCCDSKVVLRRSKKQLPFFAHYTQGTCLAGGESAQHLSAKFQIAKAAESAGWIVTTEKRGFTTEGELWIADVYASKAGSVSVAFEVQLAHQSDEETVDRQRRYAKSKVRGLWFFRQRVSIETQQIPAFQIIEDKATSKFTVLVRVGKHSQQTINLSEFIVGTLNGQLKFAPVRGEQIPAEAYGGQLFCIKCRRMTWVLTHFKAKANHIFSNFENWTFYADNFKTTELLLKTIPKLAELPAHKIGEFRDTPFKTVCITCFHCREFIETYLGNGTMKLFQTPIMISPELINDAPLVLEGAWYWWFDVRR
jgi:competence CoiA-like predicted nuclease